MGSAFGARPHVPCAAGVVPSPGALRTRSVPSSCHDPPPPLCSPQSIAEYDLKDISYTVRSPTCHELVVCGALDEPMVFNFEEEREAQKWWTIVSSSLREVQKGRCRVLGGDGTAPGGFVCAQCSVPGAWRGTILAVVILILFQMIWVCAPPALGSGAVFLGGLEPSEGLRRLRAQKHAVFGALPMASLPWSPKGL